MACIVPLSRLWRRDVQQCQVEWKRIQCRGHREEYPRCKRTPATTQCGGGSSEHGPVISSFTPACLRDRPGQRLVLFQLSESLLLGGCVQHSKRWGDTAMASLTSCGQLVRVWVFLGALGLPLERGLTQESAGSCMAWEARCRCSRLFGGGAGRCRRFGQLIARNRNTYVTRTLSGEIGRGTDLSAWR